MAMQQDREPTPEESRAYREESARLARESNKQRCVVVIVELTVPTEKTVGPFESQHDAGSYMEEARLSGRWAKEQWQRVSVLQLFDPAG